MLWQRVLTALVLMPLIIAGILYLDNATVAVVLALAMLVAAHEMAQLANLAGPALRVGVVIAMAGVLWLCWVYLLPSHVTSMQWLMAAWWVSITVLLIGRRRQLHRVQKRRPGIMLLGIVVLASAWSSIVALHSDGANGPVLVLILFVLIWVADSGAYFAGRAFGQRKLSPFVSPGKTWAGAGGAVAGAVVGAVLLGISGLLGRPAVIPLIMLGIVVTLVSIGGDLWESRLKREAGIKDSGALLPGHGGMLDRIDSLLAAAPVFGLGVGLLGVSA